MLQPNRIPKNISQALSEDENTNRKNNPPDLFLNFIVNRKNNVTRNSRRLTAAGVISIIFRWSLTAD
jgi:hypothetical protein